MYYLLPNKVPMKILIHEEMSQRRSPGNDGSRIAPHLMSEIVLTKSKAEKLGKKILSEEGGSSSRSNTFGSSFCKQAKQHTYWRVDNPRRTWLQSREHPQEEELQKFKKEFKGWQASEQFDEFDKKVPRVEEEDNNCKDRRKMCKENRRNFSEVESINVENFSTSSSKMQKSKKALEAKGKMKIVRSSSPPSMIVILKPGFLARTQIESPCSYCLSEIIEKEGDFVDLIKEVKENLMLEFEGRSWNSTMRRQYLREACFSDNRVDPKDIAKRIAEQIREKVTSDLRKPYGSKVQSDKSNSPEFANRDKRKVLSEKIKNILKNEEDMQLPPIKEGSREKQVTDISKIEKESCNDDGQTIKQLNAKSFERYQEESMAFDGMEFSSRKFGRSYSSPAAETGFGKLPSEDHRVHTKTGGFSLKRTICNLKPNIDFKGKLFGKKTKSKIKKPSMAKINSMTSSIATPSVLLKHRVIKDNFTEVPPSPATVYCSSPDEDYGQSNPSPVSPLEVPSFVHQGDSSAHDLEEFSSDRREFRGILVQANDVGCSKEVTHSNENYELKSFAGQELVSAGFYDEISFDQTFMSLEASLKSVPKWVFEKQGEEEALNKNEADEADTKSIHKCLTNGITSQRILFEMLYEMLNRVRLQGPTTVLGTKNLSDSEDNPDCVGSLVVCDTNMAPWPPCMSHCGVDVIGMELEDEVLGELVHEVTCELLT